MIYCNLERIKGSRILYSVGGRVTDITGQVVVDYKTKEYDLLKKPDHSTAYDYFLRRLFDREQANYEKGVFRNKISYEIG